MRSSKLELIGTWLRSGFGGKEVRGHLPEIRSVLLFIGTPRSGHSIIGALLDAHPDAVVSHEAGAIRYLAAGFDRDRLLRIVLTNAREEAAAGRVSEEYSYHVPGQWQGRVRELRVIGDKQAARTTDRLSVRPELRDRLREMFEVPVRFLQVSRNPFDNIATLARRAARGDEPHDLTAASRRYFVLLERAAGIRERLDATELRDVRHEDFVADPRAVVAGLCGWLGLDTTEDYLDACAGIVYDAPHRSRDKAPWTDAVVDEIGRRTGDYPWLAGYGLAP